MADVWIPFCYDPSLWSLFSWFIMIASTFIICLFSPYFTIKIWNTMKKKTGLNFLLKCMCTTIATCFMVATILISIHVTSSFYCYYSFETWLNLAMVGGFSYLFGISLLYLLFVIRLTYPFKGTDLQTPTILYVIFIIGFVLHVVLAVCVISLFLQGVEYWRWANLSLTAFQVTNLLFTIILLSVFVKKMLSLRDTDLLETIIRILLCAAMGLFSSQLPSICGLIRGASGDSEYLWVTHVMLETVDMCINLFSIYLQFPCGKARFVKVCGGCSRQCGKHLFHIAHLETELQSGFSGSNTTKASTKSTNNTSSPDSKTDVQAGGSITEATKSDVQAGGSITEATKSENDISSPELH